jgi:hypothetical protein
LARQTNIKLRRSATSGAAPTTSNLDLGELALNTYDGKVYMKKSVSGTESIVEVGSSTSTTQQVGIHQSYIYDGSDGATSNTVFSGADNNSNTLSYVVGNINVYLNGILLVPTTDYTAATSTSVTLVNSAAASDVVQIETFVKVLGTADQVTDAFTGDGSTAAYTLSENPDSENNTLVYVDGVYQEKATYAVSGTTLTFDANVPNGASIEVVIASRNVTVDNVDDLTVTGNTTLGDGAGDVVAVTGYLTVDNIKLDANKISTTNSGGDLTLDAGGDIILDADGGDIFLKDAGTTFGEFTNSSTDFIIKSTTSDKDIIFKGNDGGSAITALTLDMSNAGRATFNENVIITGDLTVSGTTTTVNSTTMDVADLNITVGSGATTSSATNGAGLTFGAWSSGTIPTLTWDHTNTRLSTNKDLSVTGALVSTSADVNGVANISGTLSLDGTANELRFYEGANYVGFEAPALSADQIWVLPTADGSSGHALKTDGSGNLSWGTAGGNAFETVAVSGQSNIVADSTTDTLTFAAGTGITLTTNASSDTVTITNSATGDSAFKTISVSGQSDVVADATDDTLTLVGSGGIAITTTAGSDTITFGGNTSTSIFGTDLYTTANNSTTAFTLSSTPDSEDSLIVFVEGVYQNKNSYSLSGTTLTLDAAPASGQEVVVHIIGSGLHGQSLSVLQDSGDGTEVNFTLPVNPLHENNTFVYLDGVYQEKATYSVSGTTLTFDTAPVSGHSIEVVIPKTTDINTPANNSITSLGMFNGIQASEITSTTVASTSATTIATHAATTYRTVKYLVQCTQGTDYHSTEINLIHDGTTVYITEYGTLYDNAVLGTFDASISGGNILLQITAGSATSMGIKVISTAIPV